jgi:hypothetical protein
MAQEIYHRSEWGNPNEQWGNVYLNADLTNELYKRASEYENSWVTDQLLNGVGTKPSIIMTPTAYEDGKLLSVKPVQTFGSELVTNGGFDTDSDWIKNTNWSISGGVAIADGTTNDPLFQNGVVSSGKFYKVSFEIKSISQGSFYLDLGISTTGQYYSSIGTYTEYIKAGTTNNRVYIRCSGNTIGSIDNVSVKEVTDADFDFTRGSSATRVNEKGLIQDVQILSDELVQNGNFEEIGSEEVSNGDFEQIGSELIVNGDFATDSDWAKGTGWTISGGSANCDGTQTGNTNLNNSSDNGIVNNKFYKIVYTISNYVSGSIRIKAGNTGYGVYHSSNGTYTQYIKAQVSTFPYAQFNADADFIGSIDNVSVKEVGQDWEFNTGWSMGDGKAISDGSANFSDLTQNNTNIVIGKNYKITYTVSDYVSGSFKFIMNNNTASGLERNANGTYTDYISALSQAYSFRTQGSGFNGSIDNISVKEVGQNWEFGDDITIQDNKAFFNNSAYPQAIEQTNVATIGNKYRVKFTVSDYQSGTVKLRHPLNIDGIQANGDYVFEGEAAYTSVVIRGDGSPNNFKIDNVSIIEITDDTDLPRINYTNFDYQDVLGDELVTNGDFDTDSDWTKGDGWNISNNKANCDGTQVSNSIFYQNIGNQSNKTVQFSFTISDYVSGVLETAFFGASGTIAETISANGNYTFYISVKSGHNGNTGFIAKVGFIGSIDNVSIKELTEDVLVPYSGEGSLLLEKQSTNLVTYSEQFDNAAWDANSDVLIESGYLAPDGTNNAYKVTKNGVNSKVALFLGGTPPFTKSIYAKTVSGTGTAFFGEGSTTGSGVLSTVTTQWQRFEITVNDNNFYGVDFRGASTLTEVLIWGAQMEEQSFSTSYIPTEGSTKTRLQDICNNAGSSDLINSTEGTLYAEISALADDGTNRCISLYDGSVNNRLTLVLGTTSNSIRAIIKSNNSTSFDEQHIVASTLDYHKICVKYKENDFALWINSVEVATDITGATPIELDRITFDTGNGTLNFYGNVKCVAVFKEALSDEELQKLTTI